MNGTELHNLAPPQGTTNGSNTPLTTTADSAQNLLPVANTSSAASTSTPVPSPSQPPSNSLPDPNSPYPSSPFHPTILRKVLFLLKYTLKPLLALLIYALTLSTAYRATSPSSSLGRISPEWGIWVLAILAKAGDISFAFAVEDAFDTLAWGKLRKRGRVRGTMGLVWWVSLLSATGVGGLVGILWRGLKRLFRRGGDGGRVPVRERWKRGKEMRWSLARLAFLIILIPGPGIILLANISPKPIFISTTSMSVTGGLATYDPRIAEVYRTQWGPEIAKLVQSTLRDRSIAWPIGAYSPACKASQSCESYLLAGPYGTVLPWPFTNETGDVDAFLLEKAPVYMVELWDLEAGEDEEEGRFVAETECVLYGGFNARDEYSTLMCIGERDEGALVAAWFVCQSGYSEDDGTCLNPGSLPGRFGWKTNMRFYRRTVDIYFSRTDFTILSVAHLSTPIPEIMSAASLFRSLNSIFYRPNQTVNDFRYDRKAQQYILTQNVGSNLWFSLRERLRGATLGRDWLRNALTMPVYLFQPTVLPINTTHPLTLNGSLPQPNLPPENQLKGSYCTVSNRAVPGRGTVIAYTCVAGVLVAFVIGVKRAAWRWGEVETSRFVMADFDVLVRVVGAGGNGEVRLRDKIVSGGRGISGTEVLEAFDGLKVGLRP
ncbi:hypothetical protein K458DRAFT_395238 [Lentithecium fluviatile CBS 122367]|uniref:Uncharacterized protein n=1 Tax=Lentithecium fluviatile CBS 122367 TaxID=1168545 RepID=A0A6G1IJQ0_9PLEO|nr:hypothetical protein K458DRAFT_395238 [Lentithecium fluviatile CBS 122367]